MTRRPLRLVEEETSRLDEEPTAARFTRRLDTPPGPPWRQRRIADLEARLGSPVNAAVAYRLVRLEPWKLGREGRFSVVYAHTGDTAALDRPCALKSLERLQTLAEEAWARRLIAMMVAAVCVFLLLVAVSSAVHRRAAIDDDLADLDQTLTHGEHRAVQIAALERQALALTGVDATGRSVKRVLGDLDWVAAHRRSDVSIASFHWISGVSAVEASSADTPFSNADRPVQRASHPLRPGTWLWGVAEPRSGR